VALLMGAGKKVKASVVLVVVAVAVKMTANVAAENRSLMLIDGMTTKLQVLLACLFLLACICFAVLCYARLASSKRRLKRSFFSSARLAVVV
jgi:uncharacterized BrkB/YihY/UPF0761 family membrane protein